MKGWLQKCLRDHKLCCLNDANKESLPTRLIDMGNIDGPRLVVCKEEGMDIQKAQYVTVSHRWRQEGMPKLLRSNAETLKQRIDPTILPLAFQDSLILAKRLDIRYIWIDALCILQDDESDWERESSIMGQVYRNAVCNFGASAAAKKPVGLFIDRDPRLASAFSVSIHRKGHEEKYFGYTEQMHDDVLKTNLSDRGWILQERLLSPRSVYFGQQLTWECSELVACETFPEGTPATRYLSPWGRSGYPFRMTNLLLKNLKYTHKDEEQHETKEIYRKWLYIAEEFMKCRLTYEDDRFPALSGLAKCFQQVLNDEYVAGLWRNDLLRGLLWRTRPNTRNLPLKGHAPYPSTYRGKPTMIASPKV
ncbi:HET-domain-containing protein [Lindgomyces ingoldianus]|uniref:HET-domain-containing protein n=1 Tax=Lindgomyces ingoldianus TaxID=673940 RepID=A0ACB6RIG1_9PLEO|nr:HET-domain-containing protein [Lindgomyces ingoldianus]KAF2478251.1 HET-domain-containing protein [Lindgomyces ingoldianus]